MRDPLPYPRLIAHRCGGALAPENTLPGLDLAARLGCRGAEFDVMLSRDGVPHLMHDDALDRTTDATGLLAARTAAALSSVDAGVRHHKAFTATPVPTFDDTLARCASLGLWANVEIKPAAGHDAATGDAVARRLSRWRGRGIASSFSLEALRAARRASPSLPIAVLFERLPMPWRDIVDELQALAVHLPASHVDGVIATTLGNVPWACYTVNTRTEADRLFALGASAVFTDRPDRWAAAEM